MAQPMGLKLRVPQGWRLLGDDEAIKDGDRCANRLSSRWHPCLNSVGKTPKTYSISPFWVIRNEPAQEKEWLNPWD